MNSITLPGGMWKALCLFLFAALAAGGCRPAADIVETNVQAGNTTQVASPLSDVVHVPSRNPMSSEKSVREMMEITVPENGNVFTDNVLSLRNLSHDAVNYGNAAIAFMDAGFTERGAVGYSRNQAIQPGGYIPNTLYIEIGNAFTEDDQDTDFRVIRTLKDGQPSPSFIPIEVLCNGEMNLRTDNGKHVRVEGGLVVDQLYLTSPNGTLFRLAVDDSGALTTRKVQ